jgi:arylsulfatase A-like enzyme
MSGLRSTACALLVGVGLSCGPAPGPDRDPRLPDVVVIVIDTLRADHLPFYGYPRDTAPFLGRLALSGVRFEHVFSTSSATAPATASIFTSLHPLEHGVVNGFRATERMQAVEPAIELNRIPAALETLPEFMAARGYRTFGVADNVNICEAMGFAAGFDRFANMLYESGERVNAVVAQWSEEIRNGEPYFLYVHYMDPHVPYHAREPWASAYASADGAAAPDPRHRYDSEINYVDERVRELYEMLQLQDAVVVVTSDHGEAFGEHGVVGHGNDLHAEVLNVPLLFHFPDAPFGGGSVAGSVAPGSVAPGSVAPGTVSVPVSTLDLLPTLRDMLGGTRDPVARGRSLWPLIAGDPRASAHAPDLLAQLVRKEAGRPHTLMTALVRGEWKLMHDSPLSDSGSERSRLFRWRSDPGELSDASAEAPRVVVDLRTRVLALAQGARSEGVSHPLDPTTLEHLRSLGYAD